MAYYLKLANIQPKWKNNNAIGLKDFDNQSVSIRLQTQCAAGKDKAFEFVATLNLADVNIASRHAAEGEVLTVFSRGLSDKDAVIEELQTTKLSQIEQILKLRKECDSLQQRLRESQMTRPHEDMKARYK